MHGGVGLQRGQRQVAALGPKGHGVSDDVAHAEAGVELAVGDVTVLALRGGGGCPLSGHTLLTQALFSCIVTRVEI